MAETASQNVSDLLVLYKALLIELPAVAAKLGLGIAKEKELAQTAWKSYDAGVRLANNATGKLFSSPLFGSLVGRSLGPLLRAQYLLNSASGALFTGLWLSVGLPTASEVQALRAELESLHHEFRSLTARLSAQGNEDDVIVELKAQMAQVKKTAAA